MKLSLLEKKLSSIPIIIKGNRESLVCSEKSLTICDGKCLKDSLDDPNSRVTDKNIVVTSNEASCGNRFPKLSIKEPFYELDFNRHMCKKLDLVTNLFFKQSDIGRYISKSTQDLDFVVLIIVDGLSYTDCLNWGNIIPCYVDTLTTTKYGFLNIIGQDESIAKRLFNNGFSRFHGFSYWDHEDSNILNDRIFRDITNIEKIVSISQIEYYLKRLNLKNAYIQIAVQGLDGFAHKNRDIPLIKPITENIFTQIKTIVNVIRTTNLRGQIIITSDHGIMWKHQCELKVLEEKSFSPRYCTTTYSESVSKTIVTFDAKYSSMKFPYVLREIKSNEWGVHGGISLNESIVPFLKIAINRETNK